MASHINSMTGRCFQSLILIIAVRRFNVSNARHGEDACLQVGQLADWLLQLRLRWTTSIQHHSPKSDWMQALELSNNVESMTTCGCAKRRTPLSTSCTAHRFQTLCHWIYVLHTLTPLYITDKCVALTSVHSGHRLHSANDGKVVRVLTVSVPLLWNTLTTLIMQRSTLGHFKIALKTCLFRIDYHLPIRVQINVDSCIIAYWQF